MKPAIDALTMIHELLLPLARAAGEGGKPQLSSALSNLSAFAYDEAQKAAGRLDDYRLKVMEMNRLWGQLAERLHLPHRPMDIPTQGLRAKVH